MGVTAKGDELSSWSDENVLELGRSNGCTTLRMY